jgi:4-hydroxybenzoate polyprenyltransferase
VLQLGKTLDADVIITFVQVFLLVVVLMIPFEIRDLNYDKFTLKTLPQLFGVRKTKILGIFLCFVVFILDYLKNEISQKHIVSTGLFLFILSVFIFNSKKNKVSIIVVFGLSLCL